MYCRNCGNQVESSHKFCAKCGVEIPDNSVVTGTTNVAMDERNEAIIFGAISFAAPLLGLIIAFIFKDKKPKAFKVGAIVASIMLAFRIIYFIFIFVVAILENI